MNYFRRKTQKQSPPKKRRTFRSILKKYLPFRKKKPSSGTKSILKRNYKMNTRKQREEARLDQDEDARIERGLKNKVTNKSLQKPLNSDLSPIIPWKKMLPNKTAKKTVNFRSPPKEINKLSHPSASARKTKYLLPIKMRESMKSKEKRLQNELEENQNLSTLGVDGDDLLKRYEESKNSIKP